MESAELERTAVDIEARVGQAARLELRATGTVIKFDGSSPSIRRAATTTRRTRRRKRLPAMTARASRYKKRSTATQHFTEPPPRYSEASLVKRMEELGIGRPSTYASILQVLQDRSYVRIEKKRLVPEDRGPQLVTAFLESFFARYVEYDFTADLEEQLDLVSNNELEWQRLAAQILAATSSAAVEEIKDLRIGQVIEALDEMLAPHIFPPRPDGTDPRLCAVCGNGPAVAKTRQVRRLHRLLELSGMPQHASVLGRRGRRRRGRPARGCSASIRTSASKSACGPGGSVPMCSSARGRRAKSRSAPACRAARKRPPSIWRWR